MNDRPVTPARFIALRYVNAGKRSRLVSFMSAVSIFGLALGVAILITVLSVMNGFDRELREHILGIVPHLTVATEENPGEQEWEEIAAAARRHRSVQSVAPVIQSVAVAATATAHKGVLVNGIDAAQEASVSAIGEFMKQGGLERLQQTRWGVVIGETLAQRLGVGIGDAVDLFSPRVYLNPVTPLASFRRFEVVGIFRVGTGELDAEFAMINLAAARALFRVRSSHNGLHLRTSDVLAADQVALELQPELPPGVFIASWSSRFGAIYENIRFSRSVVGFMLWLLVAVATFNLIVSLIMIVADKKADIAILRTLGASPGLINRLFIWQGCLIALIGIGIGVVLGIIGALRVSALATFIEERFALQILSAEVYPIDFLPSEPRITDLVVVAAGALILSLLATIYPARRAASIQPADALRSE